MSQAVKTTCPYCGVGCGVLASRQADGTVMVQGDPDHPANLGRLCSKGAALGETVDLDGRLLTPKINGVDVAWDQALDLVAASFEQTIERHGPDSVAFYVSGQFLTEDYYAANKLMKGFIGSANIDTNSRLCMSSAVAGHKRAFGADVVPGCYEDFEQADLLVLVGSNMAWCHPVLFRRIEAAKAARPEMKLVVIDPRRTASCDLADLHLPLRGGSDVALFNGLLTHLHQQGVADVDFHQHLNGMEATLAAAEMDVIEVARKTGLRVGEVQRFYEWFTATDKTVSIFSMGVNQSSQGVDKVNAITNCHLYTGRIGQPGSTPFSITGQPNAMGGREVGGLANMLAAHMDFDQADLVADFWASPAIARQPGLKAKELFEAVASGKIKAIWIAGTNPVVSMPDADKVKAALQACPMVVVADVLEHTDTSACANVLLPAQAWGEKDGTVTNSERRISRQRRFLPVPGQARPDWWMFAEVGKRLGHAKAFAWQSPAEVFAEHAQLSGHQNQGQRAFNIQGLAALAAADYEQLQPLQWPVLGAIAESRASSQRMFADGEFVTADGKANMVAVVAQEPTHKPVADFRFVLNTGRVRDHWHTMTRTGKSARLSAHRLEPLVEMHPLDAITAKVQDGQLALLNSRWGQMLARVVVTEAQRRGNIFVPIHWNAQFSGHGRVGAVVNPVVDPISGEPEFKHTPVNVQPYQASWYGFILSREKLAGLNSEYWVAAKGEQFWRYELADRSTPEVWADWTQANVKGDGEWLHFADAKAGRYRAALLAAGRLQAVVFVAPSVGLPDRAWLAGLFAQLELDEADRRSLLLGRPAKPGFDPGRTICSCFGVGVNTITKAITEQNLMNVEQVGAALNAGTNCGSCVPELKALLAKRVEDAA